MLRNLIILYYMLAPGLIFALKAQELWHRWGDAAEQNESDKTTVFVAVPTIHAKLLDAADSLPPELVQNAVNATLHPMRLQVSGYAALPVTLCQRWKALTGHTLLERYGMTEFG